MTLRSKETPSASKDLTIGDLEKGQKFDGTVKKVEDYGIFININGSRLTGLCHKSEVSQAEIISNRNWPNYVFILDL